MILLKINGIEIKHITQYSIQSNKLWADDSGRNMAGENKGTLVGVFPKILLKVKPKSKSEVSQLMNLLDLAEITVDWYDFKTQKTYTSSNYSGDYTVDLKKANSMIFEEISVNLIPNKKR